MTGAARKDIVAQCRDHKIKIVASSATPRAQRIIEDASRAEMFKLYTDVDLLVPTALIVGREATGISPAAEVEADEFAHIPMADGIESLNVAAAAAILLYEAARQRGSDLGGRLMHSGKAFAFVALEHAAYSALF